MGKKKGITSADIRYQRLLEREEGRRRSKGVGLVPSGYVPVLVGMTEQEEMERFLIHTEHFKHPSMVILLEMAAQEFGYDQQGILKIPCDANHFQRVVSFVKEKKKS
ncbi:hypothetical protein QJS10_CPB21g01108 [Acorus calamus]|uniref:Small auxin up regulated protein n=1 Tax=Acorus calamus TaxID=4465 RepID=A0AAV9C7Y6_ACOCL|nr:hypothetical protein QJS10_CPB21g01108 [Acorus calamus]